jgi:hypothetical protein
MPEMAAAERETRHELAERVEHWFVLPTTIAALLALPAVVVPLVWPDPTVRNVCLGLDWLIWGVFAVQVLVIELIEPEHVAWFRHHRLVLFVLFAAWPGWMTIFDGTGFGSAVPLLILGQKLLKLLKVDSFFRHSGTHQVTGKWLLLVPATAAIVVVWLKLGWIGGLILLGALVIGLIGPEGKPHPRVRRLVRRRGKSV